MKRNSVHVLFVFATWLVATTFSWAQSAEEIEHLLNRAQQKRHNDQYLESFNIIDSALQLANHTENKALIANCLSEKGVAAMYLGRYGKALDVFQQGLLIREELSDSDGVQESFNYIATIHHAQSDFELAKDYYEKSLELAEQTNRKRKLAVLKNNLGVLSEDQGNYLKALQYHSESLAIWEFLTDTAWISVSLRHIGKCYSQQTQLTQALVAYEKAYDLSEQSGTNTNVVRSAVSLGELKLKMRDYESARNWCEKSYDRSLNHNFLLGIQESVECLTSAFEGLNDYPKALEFYKLSQRMKDSVYGNERMKELTQLELNFQFEKEQLADSLEFVRTSLIQEKKISNQRIGLFSIGIITIIMLMLALVVYQGKQKSDSLLLNILPKKVADELKATGKSKATRFDNTTVIFTDFKGFTELSEKLTAEELVAEINNCFSAFDAIMTKYGIEKIKTIGDAYMAASGLPSPNPNHASVAVNAALEMIEFVNSRKEFLASKNKLGFEMRVGINTGSVIAGIVGTTKFQYDIWGDTVNIAARMESGGEVGKVNISHSTYNLIQHKFSCIPRGKKSVKGKGEMEMYFVQREN